MREAYGRISRAAWRRALRVLAVATASVLVHSISASSPPQNVAIPEGWVTLIGKVPVNDPGLSSRIVEPGVYIGLFSPNGGVGGAALYHLLVLNLSGSSIAPWELSLEFDGDVERAWNATVRKAGSRFVFEPENWNSVLRDGEVRDLGFLGTPADSPRSDPHSYLLHGLVTSFERPAVITSQADCQVEVSFVVHAEGTWWSLDRGFYFGEFYLRNVGEQPADWSLAWSTDHGESTGPGTRSQDSWWFLTSGEYYLSAGDREGPIEPGGTRSVAIWGDLGNQPYDPVACPKDAQLAPNPYVEAYERAYAALTDEQRRAVACYRLVWNGTDFVVPPHSYSTEKSRTCE